MTSFRTKINITKADWTINHQSKILGIGSCFTLNIGNRLERLKFPILTNPFGIIYNPISIAKSLQYIIEEKEWSAKDLFKYNNLWQSFDFHSKYSNTNQDTVLSYYNNNVKTAHNYLKKIKVLMITLGSAFVYEEAHTSNIVSNCHKLPSVYFNKRLLSVSEIISALETIIESIKNVNNDIRVILTVSPVRHIKDGIVENQRSKASLVLAIQALVNRLGYVDYFPAYEILLDDLRDYRFYNEDLLHPSKTAINYIWSFFEATYFQEDTTTINKKLQKVINAVNHRPRFPDTEQHSQFKKKQRQYIQALIDAYPFLDLSQESKLFEDL